jgi:hypothetical protein
MADRANFAITLRFTSKVRFATYVEGSSMNAMSPDRLFFFLVILAVVVIGLASLVFRRQRTLRLKRNFGPEYDRMVAKYRSRSKAEAELVRREKRLAQIKIVELSGAEVKTYSLLWESLQSRFVDDPKAAVSDANRLVQEVMQKRGYPINEFDSLEAYLSVRYPRVASDYRAACAIAARSTDQIDTEQLRKALLHYRALMNELLGITPAVATPTATHHVPVHT